MCLAVVLWCPAVELDLTSHIMMTCTCHAGQSATNEHSHAKSFRCYTSITYSYTGAETGGRGGIVPLKYLGGGDGGAFIPPMFRKCHCKLPYRD